MQRILLVSNRLPVTVTTEGGLVEVKRSLGGLATGLAGPHERTGGVWIGWPGALDGAKPEERPSNEPRLPAPRLVPIEGFWPGCPWSRLGRAAGLDPDVRNILSSQVTNHTMVSGFHLPRVCHGRSRSTGLIETADGVG